MNRKDFIASIPLLGSIPFIGKELIREEKKIILLEPKPLEIVKDMPSEDLRMDHSKLKLVLVYDGVAFGECWDHEFSHQGGMIDEMCVGHSYMTRETTLQVRGHFRDSGGRLMEAFANSRKMVRFNDIKIEGP